MPGKLLQRWPEDSTGYVDAVLYCQAVLPKFLRPHAISISFGLRVHAGRVKVVTEYYQQLPDGGLVEVKPMLEGERAVQKPQLDAAPAQGARER